MIGLSNISCLQHSQETKSQYFPFLKSYPIIMKVTVSILFTAGFLAATALAAPVPGNANAALSHHFNDARNADPVNNVNHLKRDAKPAEAKGDAEGTADNANNLSQWWFGKRDDSPSRNAKPTDAKGDAEGTADNANNLSQWWFAKRDNSPSGNTKPTDAKGDAEGTADNVDNLSQWGFGKRDNSPSGNAKRTDAKGDAEGTADNVDNLFQWGFGKRDNSPHGNADHTLASGNADKEFNSYGWAN
jgi:hypothetical protein